MPKIAVITDTDSSLPAELAAQHGILQVPISVHFEDQSYTCGVDIDDRKLFELVDRSNRLPTTSAPSPAAFEEAFEGAFQQGASGIACVCVSSKVSSTYASALSACEQFPGREIAVIDSLSVSMGEGFMALAAAEAAQRGAGKDEVAAAALDVRGRVHLFAVLSTLRYLALSGRVGKFVAGMADTLNIKPILTVTDGQLVLLERVRTHKKAVERLLELVKASLGEKPPERLALLHVTDFDRASALRSQLRAEIACPEAVPIAEFTPGLSVHAGSGVVGVVVQSAR